MYHQFKELADVDITAEPMEVGPTCHYVMGGVEVDPDTAAAVVPGLFAAGEVLRRHARLEPARRQLAVRPAGLRPSRRRGRSGVRRRASAPRRPAVTDSDVDDAHRAAEAPFTGRGGENPYTIHADLQETMNDLVGIIRTGERDRAGARQARGAQGAGQAR